MPVLQDLQRSGHGARRRQMARLLIFGALNWAVQWYDPKQSATLDDLTAAAVALFIRTKHELPIGV